MAILTDPDFQDFVLKAMLASASEQGSLPEAA